MVKGSFRKVLANPRLVKLNIGIFCLHVLLMSSFVALPGQFEQAGFRLPNTGKSISPPC